MPIPPFVVTGPPRTKKTSNRIVQIKAKGGGRGFTKILPSKAHELWFKEAMKQSLGIRMGLNRVGIRLPLRGQFNCRALFYRDRLSGDATGYYQALADFLQEPKQKNGKLLRNGAGIVTDDANIVSWDGSRLLKDARCPRIEVELTLVAEAPPETENLFPDEDEDF